MMRTIFTRSAYLAPLLATVTFLSGCASSFTVPDTPIAGSSSFGPMQGQVFGGHAPLVGAHVYLLQVATSGGAIGTSATSLLGSSGSSPSGYPLQTNPCTLGVSGCTTGDPNIPTGWEYVITDSNGGFSLTNGYLCTPNYPVYVYAYGGAPSVAGGGSGVANPVVVNLATLGLCPGSDTFAGSSVTYIYLNEVSTVATAYAFQGFTSPTNNDAVHIGFSGVNNSFEALTGIQNAANNTYQLYDINGSIAGHGANYQTYNTAPNNGVGVVPQTVLNTLGNILAACVDSGNSTRAPANQADCTTLFATATSDGTSTGTKPTDTATAAINIARHPAGVGNTSFASTLFALPTGTVPFTPNLTNAPPDFTVGIQFPSSANAVFQGPISVATDAYGDFIFTTEVTAPNPTGSPATYGTGYFAAAFPMGTIALSQFNNTYTEGNVAIDSAGDAWAGTLTGTLASSVYELAATSSYPYFAYHAYGGDSFTRAAAPVADNSTSSGNTWFPHGPTCPTFTGCGTNSNSNPTLTELLSTGAQGTYSSLLSTSFGPTAYPTHAAIDSAGYDWLTSDTPTTTTTGNGNVISRVVKTTGLPASGFPINSVNATRAPAPCGSGWIAPEQPAIDRAGNAWIPVYGSSGLGSVVFVVNPAGTTCTQYPTESHHPVGPYGAAVDGSSNVWITNTTGGSAPFAGTGSLAELNYTTGASLSSTNFQPENQVGATGTPYNLLADPLNVAVDISGDVFVTNFSGNSIVELIGLATPVYGPLGVAAGASQIGEVP